MKFVEKFTLILYANIILIISIILGLIIFGWLDINLVGGIISKLIYGDTSSKIILGVCAFFILLSIKCIFFDSSSKKKQKTSPGVLLENDNGKLLISKETIENLVDSIALNFENSEQVSTRVDLDKDNNVIVYINLTVNADVVIKDLSAKLQTEIKDKIKTATDLEGKEVNIAIKRVVETEPEVETEEAQEEE